MRIKCRFISCKFNCKLYLFICRYFNENAESIICCTVTDLPYRVLLCYLKINKLNLIGIPVNIDLLLFGNETPSCDIYKLFHIFRCTKIH